MRTSSWILRGAQDERQKLILLLCVAFFAGCATAPRSSSTSPAKASTPLAPSPNRIIGRVLAIDAERAFAFIDLAADAPAGALANGVELATRTLELRETGRVRASSYVRGKTLGTRIVSGQPSPGDEVVWRSP